MWYIANLILDICQVKTGRVTFAGKDRMLAPFLFRGLRGKEFMVQEETATAEEQQEETPEAPGPVDQLIGLGFQ